jgi:hypothetical protein
MDPPLATVLLVVVVVASAAPAAAAEGGVTVSINNFSPYQPDLVSNPPSCHLRDPVSFDSPFPPSIHPTPPASSMVDRAQVIFLPLDQVPLLVLQDVELATSRLFRCSVSLLNASSCFSLRLCCCHGLLVSFRSDIGLPCAFGSVPRWLF